MLTRRDFLQTAAALGSSSFAWGAVPEVIARAMEIDPDAGTTFHDAEHVVVLMQENRSFDHAFGSLSGVRGFRDPRPHLQSEGTPVWFQPEKPGAHLPPFRLDIEGTNVTWIGGNPHSWGDQIDARNGGRYDNWIHAKKRSDGFPMTMGFFTREDIPFYYALADAFTICDQAFCSSLTGTTPNRLFLWTGTIREDAKHPARVENGDTDYGVEAAWTTFPERLEEEGVSWRIYQNELSIDSGLEGEGDAWLSNFTDNPIEWFSQYHVRFAKTRRAHVEKIAEGLATQVADVKATLAAADLGDDDRPTLTKRLDALEKERAEADAEVGAYHEKAWEGLSAKDKAIHAKAFSNNEGDPDFRTVVEHAYADGETERKVFVPKGDVLHQFRQDVDGGKLPAVSWLVAPERFSDHPGSAWFGAWYVSEVLNILTKDPEVWKKTVFILCYDENDGYFDHVPPFVAPHPNRPETGKVSAGIDTSLDVSNAHGRDHSIGLGYRCPLIIASPWTRGGCVNSQVFDHTSMITFMETWLRGKGVAVHESNISNWRRTVCGDLTSAFRPYNGEKIEQPKFLERDAYIERIHKASFKGRPKPGATIAKEDIAHFPVGAFQERGGRPSCPLPYRIEASILPGDGETIVRMEAGRTAGCPFNAYSYGDEMIARAYAVRAGDKLEDRIPATGDPMVRIDGPNGFMREFRQSGKASFTATASRRGGDLSLVLKNTDSQPIEVELGDESYGATLKMVSLSAGQTRTVTVSTTPGKGWYDVTATSGTCSYRFAGRIETGQWGVTDPAMA